MRKITIKLWYKIINTEQHLPIVQLNKSREIFNVDNLEPPRFLVNLDPGRGERTNEQTNGAFAVGSARSLLTLVTLLCAERDQHFCKRPIVAEHRNIQGWQAVAVHAENPIHIGVTRGEKINC